MHGRNLHWEKLPAWWQAGDDDIFGDGTTYRIFLPSPGVYELWVWSGPAEGSGVLGRWERTCVPRSAPSGLARMPILVKPSGPRPDILAERACALN